MFAAHLKEAGDLLARMRVVGPEFVRAVDAISAAVANRCGPILIAGNGGSAADAMHFAAELVGRFEIDRHGYAAIALSDPAILTAVANDYGFEQVFARQVRAHGEPGGVFIGFSTSGESNNILKAIDAAREKEMTTIAFTSERGVLRAIADIALVVPSINTAHIQEMHVVLYHAICRAVDGIKLR